MRFYSPNFCISLKDLNELKTLAKRTDDEFGYSEGHIHDGNGGNISYEILLCRKKDEFQKGAVPPDAKK